MNELEKLTGMVLKQAPIGEFDKRLVLLTREHGKVTVFAKGARRQNSPLLAPTNPFVFGVFFCFRGRDSFRLSQVEAKEYFRELSMDLELAMYGFYFLEFADYYTRENNDESEMLKLLYGAMKALIRGKQDKRLIRYTFELKAMVLNGEYPEVFACTGCGKKEGLFAFSLRDDGFLCETCAKGRGRRVKTSTVYTFQYIVSSPVGKVFAFDVTEEILQEIQWIMEGFRKKWIDHAFHSLQMLETGENS